MTTATSSMDAGARRKAAELLSTTGALVLGVGIGLMLPVAGSAIALLTIALGILSHGWGMYERHRLDLQSGAMLPWWANLLYWLCWIGLAALAVYFAVQFIAW